jgi:hypothetical protein
VFRPSSLAIHFSQHDIDAAENHHHVDHGMAQTQIFQDGEINKTRRVHMGAGSVPIPPSNDLESAVDLHVMPGNYIAIVRSKNNSTGNALVEFYELP